MPALRDVLALMDEWYPPQRAHSWDAVGLVCGDPADDVRRILLAVDPVQAVADEAVEFDADLVITHHPLFLKGTSSVATTTPKGRVVHRLLTHGCALLAAHTNADTPALGVSDALATALGLVDTLPLLPEPLGARDTVVVFAPIAHADDVRAAMTDAGAGSMGAYDSCSFTSVGEGRFRPLEGSDPTIGSVGDLSTVAESRIEVGCARSQTPAVIAAMKAAHPYEHPAYDVIERAQETDPTWGLGRVGRLSHPMALADFAARVATVLPRTSHGVRVAGDPAAHIERVAVSGGAGDSLLETARASGAQAFVTSDLRHHLASETREHNDLALLDVAHWAGEWMWLPVLRDRLAVALGDTVELRVSTTNTDPWTFRV